MGKTTGFIEKHREKVAPLLIVILVVTILLTAFTEPKKVVTMEAFNKIEREMTYEQVVEILGEGEEIVEPRLEKVNAKMYEWINPDGSGMSMVIKEGVVSTHMQFGLE